MSDQSPLSLADLAKPASHTLSLIKFGVLAVSVAAAIPTAKNLYFSWTNGVPFNQVEHRLNQAVLLERNFGCPINYRAVSNTAEARVDVGACNKTGDISIRVSRANAVNYEWIAFDQLPKPTQSAGLGLLDLVVSRAEAAGVLDGRAGTGEVAKGAAAPSDGRFVVAQGATEVMCQAKKSDVIVRVIKEGAKCVRETVSIFRGTVEKREDVPCDKACPIAK